MGKRENVKIVLDGFKAEPPLSDDDILKQLYDDGGVAFGELRSVFNDIIKEKGLRLTPKERTIKTNELMEGTEKIETADEVLKIVAMLADKLKVATTKAMGSLRTWAKANNVDLPKAPRISKPRKIGFGGHYKNILDFMLANRDCDKDAVKKYCHGADIPEAYATQAMNMLHFAKIWAGEIEVEVEEVAKAA